MKYNIANLKYIKESFPMSLNRIPIGWDHVSDRIANASSYRKHCTSLQVLLSVDTMTDETSFIHLSVSRGKKIPSWEDLTLCKRLFIGDGLEAYQVMPKEEDYINVCKTCLHIWCPIDRRDVEVFRLAYVGGAW